MALARLSSHVSATFLSFFRTTPPQLSRNFWQSPCSHHMQKCLTVQHTSLHNTLWRTHMSHLRHTTKPPSDPPSAPFSLLFLTRPVWPSSHTTVTSLHNTLWRTHMSHLRHTPRNHRPIQDSAPTEPPTPQLSRDFRPFATIPQLLNKLSRKSGQGQSDLEPTRRLTAPTAVCRVVWLWASAAAVAALAVGDRITAVASKSVLVCTKRLSR